MDVSLNWLKEYAPFDCDMKTFAEDMTMSGSKVEVYSTEKDKIRNVVVGRVVSLDKHPNADKLTVCGIDIGSEETVIVTGAKTLLWATLCLLHLTTPCCQTARKSTQVNCAV